MLKRGTVDVSLDITGTIADMSIRGCCDGGLGGLGRCERDAAEGSGDDSRGTHDEISKR